MVVRLMIRDAVHVRLLSSILIPLPPPSRAVLHSRDQPDTADKHEIALKSAEALVRRNPPDLAHRAPELSRDLLYMENSFDLEV